jgi:hypothetical protein
MGVTFREEEFAADYQDACTDPRKLSKWLRYSLNVWTESDNRWFQGDSFSRLKVDRLDIPEGRTCFAGLDLASVLNAGLELLGLGTFVLELHAPGDASVEEGLGGDGVAGGIELPNDLGRLAGDGGRDLDDAHLGERVGPVEGEHDGVQAVEASGVGLG